MKIVVGVKRVVDYNVKVRVKVDGSGVELANVRMSMNPFDEIALEEAIRLREKGLATEIIAVSIGMDTIQQTLRTALAMGADRAILIECKEKLEPLDVARVFREVAKTEKVDLVILGKQAIDDDSNQTGQMLAGLLGWGQATFASEVQIKNDEVIVSREVDTGKKIIAVRLPAVITTDLQLNEPRYATLGINVQMRFKVVKVEEPAARQTGIRVKDVAELVEKIRHVMGALS